MSKATNQGTKAKAAALRAEAAKADRRRRAVVIGTTAAGLLVVGGAVGWGLSHTTTGAAATPASSASSTAVAGLVSYSNRSRNHVTGPVTYPQTPPVGGDHSAVWLNAGIYDKPVPNENAVHTLEHGGFWITYQPSLAADQVTVIKTAVSGQPYALVSPYPGQPAAVEATAWGVQLKLDSATDPRLAAFIAAYADASKAPEPHGEVTGGTGTPTG
ncbi:MAG: DUF3105 domain-containing protein [Candidatus Nanopelagicales bacterium]